MCLHHFIIFVKLTQTRVTTIFNLLLEINSNFKIKGVFFKKAILKIGSENPDNFHAVAQDEPLLISVCYAFKSMPESSTG